MRVKKIFIAGIIFAMVPLAASALTLEEIKAQVESMLARVEALKAQAGNGSSATSSVSNLPRGLPCLSLGRTLMLGVRGEDVRELQRYLIAAQLLEGGNATGYFGLLTENAVKRFQSTEGVVSSGDARTTGYGAVGPKTRAVILARCVKTDAPITNRCPVAPAVPLASACNGSWVKGQDASGCLTGYQCVASSSGTTASTPTSTPPRIEITSPNGGIVTGGNTLSISWKSTGVSRGNVSLELLEPEDGKSLGVVASNLSHSGTYLWRVPSGSSKCLAGESAFDCIAKFTNCEGSASLCSIEPGTYRIRASLSSTVHVTSGSFQIAGSDVNSILQTIMGAPIVPPPTPSPSPSTTAGAGVCAHAGSFYQQGATLSVPCEAGYCPSSGTGYITGECKANSLWCIPGTSYCAPILTRINMSAYEGGGAAPIGSGHSASCGSPGLRVYMTCTVGSCRSGYHICQGGSWVYDSSQDGATGGSCRYYTHTFKESETTYGNPCPAVSGGCGAAVGPQLQCRSGEWVMTSTGKSICAQATDGSLDGLSEDGKNRTVQYLKDIGCDL